MHMRECHRVATRKEPRPRAAAGMGLRDTGALKRVQGGVRSCGRSCEARERPRTCGSLLLYPGDLPEGRDPGEVVVCLVVIWNVCVTCTFVCIESSGEDVSGCGLADPFQLGAMIFEPHGHSYVSV